MEVKMTFMDAHDEDCILFVTYGPNFDWKTMNIDPSLERNIVFQIKGTEDCTVDYCEVNSEFFISLFSYLGYLLKHLHT